MSELEIYCGWHRDTIVKVKPKIVDEIVFEIPCLECGGTGVWDYFLEEMPACPCVNCKGTGKQYVGI